MSVRRLAKAAVFAVCLTAVAPFIALAWVEKHLLQGDVLFSLFAQLLALFPGAPGSYLRGAYYFGTLEGCSWEVHVGFGSIFTHRGGALASRVSMGSYCVIGHARIGAEAMIGSRVSMPSGKRQHVDDMGKRMSATRYETITIGTRTWVGEGAIIMANVGSDCIVSAGAVVTREMPSRVLIGGNPAIVIRELE
jgi:acetyltransferase-like isoleucine patch superfamily enzyme